MDEQTPLNIWLERSVDLPIGELVKENVHLFSIVDRLDLADVIVFQNDAPNYIRSTKEFLNWSHKCIVISETDEPYFFLPHVIVPIVGAGLVKAGQKPSLIFIRYGKGPIHLF